MIYIVVETDYDHHENMGIFEDLSEAEDLVKDLEEKERSHRKRRFSGYIYSIEEWELGSCGMPSKRIK